MNREWDKKEQERFFLQRFLERMGVAAIGIEGREGPDFLVHLPDRSIGIEVTRLHIRESSPEPLLQAVESVTERIISKAQKLYMGSDGIPALVTVLFGVNVRPEKVQRDSVARGLVGIVLEMALQPGEHQEWRSWDEENFESPLAEVIDTVYAWAVPDPGMARWRTSRVGWVAPLTPERLQSRIHEKSGKIDSYLRTTSENWLLIFANGMNPSQAFSVPGDFPSDQVSSPFERTFFYKYPDGDVLEI